MLLLAWLASLVAATVASGMGRVPGSADGRKAAEILLETRRVLLPPDGVPLEAVTTAAEAAVRLKALGMAAEMLSTRSGVRLSGNDPARLLVLAGAVYPVSVAVESLHNAAGEIRAVARVFTPPRDPDFAIRDLLRNPERLGRLREALILYRSTTDESLALLDAVAKRGRYAAGAAVRAQTLAARLRGLELYMDLTCNDAVRTAPADAEQRLLAALERDSDNSLLRLALGEALHHQGRDYAALEALNTAARLNAPPRVHYARGLVHLSLHMPALAAEDFARAAAAEPDNPARAHALGFARFLAGETGAMCADFYRACALGLCDGLEDVRARGWCLPEKTSN